jgi:hypothetical protein
MLSRQAVARRDVARRLVEAVFAFAVGSAPPATTGFTREYHGGHARCTVPSPRVPQDEVLELRSDRMCHGIAMCGPRSPFRKH